MANPGIYPKDNDIIPYSPRRGFGFMSNKIIKLESMREMTIDQLVELYKEGYEIEDTSPTISTAQGVYVSTGSLLVGIGIVALAYYLYKVRK